VEVDGGGPALLAPGAGEHGAPDHHPQVAEGNPAGHADEVDAVGGRQDLERGDQAAAAVLALEVVVPEGLGEERRLVAAGAAGPPASASMSARLATMMVRMTRLPIHPSSDDVSVDATTIPLPSEQAPHGDRRI
jgi:hypothetical protein